MQSGLSRIKYSLAYARSLSKSPRIQYNCLSRTPSVAEPASRSWQPGSLADVFSESRSSHTSDLNRNALVSVLLRVLEYCAGILILTTNRIREFDVAVQSRVNLGVMYDDLETPQKLKIIENFLEQLRDENVEGRERIIQWFKEDEDGDRLIKSRALNGRQVRNILFFAASLAMKDGKVLKLDHVKRWQGPPICSTIALKPSWKLHGGKQKRRANFNAKALVTQIIKLVAAEPQSQETRSIEILSIWSRK